MKIDEKSCRWDRKKNKRNMAAVSLASRQFFCLRWLRCIFLSSLAGEEVFIKRGIKNGDPEWRYFLYKTMNSNVVDDSRDKSSEKFEEVLKYI